MKKNLVNLIIAIGLLVNFFQSINADWVPTNGPSGAINVVAISDSDIYAGTYGFGIFHSINKETKWTAANSGLTKSNITSIAVKDSNVFVGTIPNGVFVSSKKSLNWFAIDSGLTDLSILSLAASGNNIIVQTIYGGAFVSTNNGASWRAINGFSATVEAFAQNGSKIFAGTNGDGVFVSTNNGLKWTAINSSFPNIGINSLAVSGNNIFTGTENGIYFSTINGTSWTKLNSGLTDTLVKAVTAIGNILFAGTSSGIFRSDNSGKNWSAANNGLINFHVRTLAANGANIFAGTESGIFVSKDSGNSWTAINFGLTNITSSLFVNGADVYAVMPQGVVLFDQQSQSWPPLNSANGLNPKVLSNGAYPYTPSVNSFTAIGTNIFTGTTNGLFISTNKGSSWTNPDSGYHGNVTDLATNGSYLLAGEKYWTFGIGGGMSSDYISQSSNGGKNWTGVWSGNQTYSLIVLFGSESGFYGITMFGYPPTYGFIFSANNGSTWTGSNINSKGRPISIIARNANIFIGTISNGALLSTDTGATWIPINSGFPDTTSVNSFALSGSDIFAGTSNGVFISANNGTNWHAVNTGLSNLNVASLAIKDSSLFAAISVGGVWRRSLSEMMPVNTQKPRQEFSQQATFKILSPNRTNHFATIEFSLPRSEQAIAKIYNLSGHEIASLVNENHGSGTCRFVWNTRDVAPGCYAVKVRAGSNTYVKNIPVTR